jgi:hypothetical protein
VKDVGNAIRALDREVVLAVVKVVAGDGHTIFDPKAFLDAGMPEDLVKHFTNEYKSDRSHPKATIFGRNGEIIDKMEGVYGLPLIESLAANLAGFRSSKMGRGFACRDCCEALREHFSEVANAADV